MLTNSKTGALLHEDHMATIECLQNLDEFLRRNKGAPNLDDKGKSFLSGLSGTLRGEVESHFGFEEGHLFPLFERKGETGIVMMLTMEHRAILPLAIEVADLAAKAVEHGFDDADWRSFRDCGMELVEREIFHIQKEEMGLLAAISALLDPTEDDHLAQTYEQTVG